MKFVLHLQHFPRQFSVIFFSISVMCQKFNLFFCEIDHICAFNFHSDIVRTRILIDDAGAGTGLKDKLFKSDMIDICDPYQQIQIRDSLSGFIVGVCLP